MNQRKIILTIMIVFAALVISWAADGVRVRMPHPDTPEGSIAPEVDLHIPFDLRVSSSPGPYCNPLDVDLIVETGEDGTGTRYIWRVMGDGMVQLECEDFYDLYYRCEDIACFNLRVVTVEASTGRVLSIKRGHVCID